ncbi:MAG: AMP-binding protein [Candidatus Dormibacteraeota bacterium]|nr:AMP-binding protein [Candidatus Dormibacteraeota bacterium]
MNLTTLRDVIALMSRRRGGLTFVDGGLTERRLSYPELAASAGAVGAALRARGVRSGDRICLIGRTSPELVIGLFATWHAGAVPVVLPLLRRRQLQEVRRRIDQVNARMLLAESSLKDSIPSLDGTLVVSVDELLKTATLGGDWVPEAPDDLALLQFTSGSTAHPRAVALAHRQILHQVRALRAVLSTTGADTWVSWLPLYHDMGLIWLVGAAVFGAPMVLEPPEEFLGRPSSWLDAISRYGANGTGAPNFAFGLAARDLALNPRRLDLSSLRNIVTGAEPIDLQTLTSFALLAERYGLPRNALRPAYGLAEATVAVTIARPDQPVLSYIVYRESLGPGSEVRRAEDESSATRTLVSCGKPIPDTDVRILTAAGAPQPAWHVGEIAVRGPSVMLSYWSEPKATADVLRDGWLRTGDLGFITDDGELVVCGRLKDMIIAGGRNIYPEEYERVAESIAGVRPSGSMAFALPEMERMVLVVEVRHATVDPQELASRVLLQVRAETGYAPGELVLVRAGGLPRTSSGKKQRGLCRELYLTERLPVLTTLRR